MSLGNTAISVQNDKETGSGNNPERIQQQEYTVLQSTCFFHWGLLVTAAESFLRKVDKKQLQQEECGQRLTIYHKLKQVKYKDISDPFISNVESMIGC